MGKKKHQQEQWQRNRMNRKTNEPDLRGGGMKESKKEKQMNLPTRPKPKKPITASEQEAEHTTPKKTHHSQWTRSWTHNTQKNPALQGSKGSANNPRRDESNGKPHH